MKSYLLETPSYPFFTINTHMFSRDFRLSASESAGHEISTIVDKLMLRRMIYPPRKAAWKVALWAPHRRSAASRGGGGFDLVIACREEWEMSPGGDERTDLRQVGESTASLFCSGPTTAHKPPGPTWGWIVLAASLVLLDDVSAYFKRIGTFYRGKMFRRETKLHHRKNVSALRKKRKELRRVERRTIASWKSEERRENTLLVKKVSCSLRSKDNLSWTFITIRKDS